MEIDKSFRSIDSFRTKELLNPERMDLETISDILRQRGVDIPPSTKEKALEVYKDLVLPRPQRILNSRTRVGRRLLNNRHNASFETEQTSDMDNNESPGIAPRKRPPTSDPPKHNNNNNEIEGSPAIKKRRAEINWP